MPKPKYRQWLEDVAGIRGWDVNEMIHDNTYNYEHFYNTQPKEAQAILKRNADAHFTDIAKTAFHPTFSIESDYSGKVNKYNPKGIIGGTWSDAPNLGRKASRYTLSDSQMKHRWDVRRTIDYLTDAETNGAELRMPDGSYPIIDGIRFGGVLPEITVFGKSALSKAAPVDNTRIVINPSMRPATLKDNKRLNKANERAIMANAEALYSVLRFAPYVKYLTDVGDITGYNPATINKRNKGESYTPDFSDFGAIFGGQPIDFANKDDNLDYSNKPVSKAKKHPYRRSIHNNKINRKLSKAFVKYNPLKMVSVVGDIIQGKDAAIELFNANKNLQQTKESIDWRQQPFRIDTETTQEDNDRFNSQFIKPRRYLGGNY
uniref:Capsid protein n=1 Tax=Geladintestivirus 6 TaxID=3233138 RepID=A0AAU8MKK3_9CAUD